MKNRITGIVKQFSNNEGSGLIAPENGTQAVFVHHSAIQGSGFRTLEIGERVEFSLESNDKGLCATDVIRL